MRVLTRYWFVIPLLVIVVGLQLGIGFVVVRGADIGLKIVRQETNLPSPNPLTPALSTSIPTNTPVSEGASASPEATPTNTPVSKATPTFTPSPTRTPTPTDTPTGMLTPITPLPPSATPTSTFTPTPGPTPIGQGISLDVPILMYHYISVPPPEADDIRLDLSVTPAQFEAHLAYLRQAGYETISMRQLAYALSQQAPLPPKPIIITFDDGYRDNYENAFPLLRKYGYTGVFFVFNYPIDTGDANYLTWDMVIEMHKAGMEIGSHSYRHWDLRGRDADFLIYEIVGSKEAIEQRIGEPVRFFAYPFGYYDDLTKRVIESAHFWNAVTTELGIEQSFDNRFEMPRIRMHGYDQVDELAKKLKAF
jgi:peptidoglycan/xylan/chitin deacetylase (PgdA/CDA1 family)